MNKKSKNIVMAITLCLGLILVGTKAYATTGKTLNDSTRLRKKASTSSDIVETLPKNEELQIISEDGDWYKVKCRTSDGWIEGYIRNDLLEVEKEEKETKKETETKTEEKKEDEKEEETDNSNEIKEENEMNIKENIQIQVKSDTQLKLLPVIFSCKTGIIAANTEVTVTEILGNWCHIQSENQEGWVMTSMLESTANQDSSKEDEKNEDKSDETKQEEKEDSKKEEKSNTKLYVGTTTLNVREKAETGSRVITQLDRNNEVTVLEVVDNTWTKIKYGQYTGYVASEYLSKTKDTTSRGSQESRTDKKEDNKKEETKKEDNKKEETKKEDTKKQETKKETETKKKTDTKKETASTETKKEENKTTTKKETTKTTTSSTTKKETETKKSSSKTTGSEIIAYAKKYLGCKYVYGATGPKTFDCSGFTQYVYKHFGYSISRTSSSQRGDGKVIKSKSNLQLGDIVCFPGHVGLYVGGGKFIHASHTGSDVKISSLSSSYYKNKFIQGTRILK